MNVQAVADGETAQYRRSAKDNYCIIDTAQRPLVYAIILPLLFDVCQTFS
jgi:hypothetical protein